MRICIIADLRYPIADPPAGGLQIHTRLLIEGMAARGHDIVLIGHEESDVDVELIGIDGHPNMGQLELFAQYRKAAQTALKSGADLIHVNGVDAHPLIWLRNSKIPVTSTLHIPPYKLYRLGSKWLKKYQHVQFISISYSLLNEWDGLIAQGVVIHNGVDTDAWQFCQTPIDPAYAVWYGRIHPTKAPHLAAEAARTAQMPLRIMGPISDQAYFEEQLKPLLDDDVIYLGHLSGAEMRDVVAQASVGLFTSMWDEPFGLVLVEMLACGLPVAAFDSGAARELIPESAGWIVPKGDAKQLAQVMQQYKKMSRQVCRDISVEQFQMSRMIDQYESLFLDQIKV